MTHSEFLKLLEERPLRMAPQPESPAVPAKSQTVAAKVHDNSEERVGTGAVVLLVALVFWTTYFLMARLTGGI
jgi:hypothetical protein